MAIPGASIVESVTGLSWSNWWPAWSNSRGRDLGVRVTATFSAFARPEGAGPGCLSVTIANTGPVPITLGSPKLRVTGDAERRSLFPTDWMQSQPPQPLPVGDQWTTPPVPIATLRAELATHFPDITSWKLVAVVTDISGVEYSDDLDLNARNQRMGSLGGRKRTRAARDVVREPERA